MADDIACIPYHTSALSGEEWIQELITRHPQCIWDELGVYWSTFTILLKAIQDPLIGFQSLCHVSIEEQLSIFLYTMVTGLSCTHVGEHFQQSTDTITKWVLEHSFIFANRYPGILSKSYKHLRHPLSIQDMYSSLMLTCQLLLKLKARPSSIHSSVVLWVLLMAPTSTAPHLPQTVIQQGTARAYSHKTALPHVPSISTSHIFCLAGRVLQQTQRFSMMLIKPTFTFWWQRGGIILQMLALPYQMHCLSLTKMCSTICLNGVMAGMCKSLIWS